MCHSPYTAASRRAPLFFHHCSRLVWGVEEDLSVAVVVVQKRIAVRRLSFRFVFNMD